MSVQDQLKQQAAVAAVDYILPMLRPDSVIGVGTGSTVDFFIDQLAHHSARFRAAVSSSVRSSQRLSTKGIALLDLNDVDSLCVYVDGADELHSSLAMIKGGGGALTQEKIVASLAKEFVCIVDDSKCVSLLGTFPVPIEVIPMARAAVARQLAAWGVQATWRRDVVTDNGGHVLDVSGWAVDHAEAIRLETQINNIPGVITCGFFAQRPADLALVASQKGIEHRRAIT